MAVKLRGSWRGGTLNLKFLKCFYFGVKNNDPKCSQNFISLLLVDQLLDILRFYHNDNVKPDDYIFPLLDNNEALAKFVTQADKDRMKPELRH